MFDDELDELRDQEQALLDELESADDREAREQIERELEDVQTEIEDLEEQQMHFTSAILWEMFEEDEAGDDSDWGW